MNTYVNALPPPIDSIQANEALAASNQCFNYDTNFAEESYGWSSENSARDTYEQKPDGIQMNLVAPIEYVRLTDELTKLPYNKYMGRGPTFNSTFHVKYGTVTARLKTGSLGGSITAFVLIADNGDEIDFEFIGGEKVYDVNGAQHTVPGAATSDEFHAYTFDWKPESITWLVDGQVVRVQERSATCKGDDCKFPSSPSRIQIGLWDGSFQYGTAQWSRGPIDWTSNPQVSSTIGSVQVTCDANHNTIFD
ncbi:unnamed protein product [Cunninghamella echinulata]